MTVIVGVIGPDGVTIASDTMVSSRNTCRVSGGKIISAGNALFGVSGSHMLNRFLHGETPTLHTRSEVEALADRWMAWALERSLFKTEEAQMFFPSTAIIATPLGELWCLQFDGTVVSVQEPYAAIGAGDDLALGALAALVQADVDYSAQRIASLAVQTAILHSPWCGGDVDLQHLPMKR